MVTPPIIHCQLQMCLLLASTSLPYSDPAPPPPAPPSLAPSIFLPQDPPTPQAHADVSTYVEEPWYHGDISCDVAEERLTALDSDNFLVRKSQSQPGKYVLSVSYGKAMKHFMIRKENQRYEVEGAERIFSSLQELVAFYNEHYLTTDWELLTIPCPPQRLKPRHPRPSPISVQGVSISIIISYCPSHRHYLRIET